MNTLLNRIVRGYLRVSPITEGKHRLLEATENWITPAEAHVRTAIRHGFSMQLNLGNPEHRRIYFYGEHDERYETRLLKRLLRRGDVFWDIGANIGFYSCLAAMIVGPEGKVVAFEPASAARRLLEANVALNRFENVSVRTEALGDTEATAMIHFADSELAEGTASLLPIQGQGASEPVTVTRLDTIRAQLPAPAFVKIDVEGMQLEVWRGGASFFSHEAPLVLAELRETSEPARLEAMRDCVVGCGYRIFEIGKRGLHPIESIVASKRRNFILGKLGSSLFRRLDQMIIG
jgi:FkbM family methyltransferase